MKLQGVSKSGLFLTELIFVILLFAISAAICLQMFAYASNTAKEAESLSNATLVARSVAECFQATQGDLEQVATILAGTVYGDTVTIAYDADWNGGTEDAHMVYTLVLERQGNGADIAVYETQVGQPIYTLTVAIPQGGGL